MRRLISESSSNSSSPDTKPVVGIIHGRSPLASTVKDEPIIMIVAQIRRIATVYDNLAIDVPKMLAILSAVFWFLVA